MRYAKPKIIRGRRGTLTLLGRARDINSEWHGIEPKIVARCEIEKVFWLSNLLRSISKATEAQLAS